MVRPLSQREESVPAVAKKSGRPLKKRVVDGGMDLITQGSGEVDSLVVDDQFFWDGWSEALLDMEDKSLLDMLDMEDKSDFLPPSSFLLSILLSDVGSTAFIIHATDVAASIGLQLEEEMWILLHHQQQRYDLPPAQLLEDSVLVAHSSHVPKTARGQNLTALLTGNDDVFPFFVRHLNRESSLQRCSIGTILMNQTIIRGNGKQAKLGSSYVFYDEEGHGRFQFVVARSENHIPIIGAAIEAPETSSMVRSTLKYEDP